MTLSLYNKYRPQTFKDVVGQSHVETTLANAVEKNVVSHAYLFCGPRGTGKTTTARILAKALLCNKAPTATPDGTCEQCREISEGIHPDVYELDAASRTGVDNVREEIIGRVNFAPTHGAYKIYIIDEVHMLSTPAFNALLKTLEEPPSHVVFVLCTTDVHKVPDTVQARCQRFDFKRLTSTEIVGRLQYICEREGFDAELSALDLIAQRSQGGMRDAIRSLEQASVFSGGKISYSAAESLLGMVDAEQLFALCDNLAAGDAAACFDWVAGYVQSGSDIAILVTDLAAHVRNLYAVSVSQGSDEHLVNALEIEADSLPRLRQQAADFSSAEHLAWMLTTLGSLSAELKNAANARLALEVALTRMLRPESELSLTALATRVAQLEAHMAGTNSATRAVHSAAVVTKESMTVDTENSVNKEDLTGGGERALASSATTAGSEGSVANVAAGDEAGGLESDAPRGVAGADDLYRLWDAVVDFIKKEKGGVAASLGGITPKRSKDNKQLILMLPARASTSRQYLQTDANAALLRKAVAKIFGEPLEVKLTVAPEAPGDLLPPSAPQTAADPEATSQLSSAVQEADPSATAHEQTPQTAAAQKQDDKAGLEQAEGALQEQEPTKEELENILSNSLNSQIRFEE